jgi:ABC-type multidrug transport system ATPase subunit
MDPKTRRSIWDLITKIKKQRAIILTSHLMIEADSLSDRILVVAKGEVTAIGTPLFLKNLYGQGYRLSIMTEADKANEVIAAIANLVPSSSLIDSSGGNLFFLIPFTKTSDLKKFFKITESELHELD